MQGWNAWCRFKSSKNLCTYLYDSSLVQAQLKMGCGLFFSWIWPKKFQFPKLIYGMNLLLVWSIWVGWFISYSTTTPWFGWFCIYSLISTVDLVNHIFPYMTLKSGNMKFFIISCEYTLEMWDLMLLSYFWKSICRAGRGRFWQFQGSPI